MSNPTVLGLDTSSATIGWCFIKKGHLAVARTIVLGTSKDDIADRCAKAQRQISSLIAATTPDAVAIEEVVWRFPNSTIPQALVHGAILAELATHQLAYCEIAPKCAKLALASTGKASKEMMLRAAAPHFGYEEDELVFEERHGTWYAVSLFGEPIYDEHAADALGVALAALPLVRVGEVAA